MGFFEGLGNMISATVKVAAMPLAIGSDIVKAGIGLEVDSTKKLCKSIEKDTTETLDSIMGINDEF